MVGVSCKTEQQKLMKISFQSNILPWVFGGKTVNVFAYFTFTNILLVLFFNFRMLIFLHL